MWPSRTPATALMIRIRIRVEKDTIPESVLRKNLSKDVCSSACSSLAAAAQSEASAIPSEGARHGEGKERGSDGLPHCDPSTHARQRRADNRLVQEGTRR